MVFFEPAFLKALAAGTIFGGAITAAGVYHPSVIFGQMKLEDFLMLKVFLTATATSAIVIPLARYFKFTETKPNTARSIGLFGKYDANIIGGSMLGIGMALTGACPGTVLPQIATGIRSSLFVGIGGILGGMLFASMTDLKVTGDDNPTIYRSFGVSEPLAILGYQGVCGLIVAGAMYFAPGEKKSLVSPILGGLLVGASQAVSLVLTGRTLGVSAAYEQAARSLLWLFSDRRAARPNARSTTFVAGAMLGSLVLSRLVALPSSPEVNISALRAIIGGGMLIFGGRLAQGCTSGHGISGMSQLSVSSFITVASMFAGGIAWGTLIN